MLRRVPRRVKLLFLLFFLGLGYFLYWDLTTNFCIEESSCIPTFYYFRDYVLRSLHLAYSLDDAPLNTPVSHDKVIVIAYTEKEDISWVQRRLPEQVDTMYSINH